MEFKKYSSLTNHYQTAAIAKIVEMGLAEPQVEWTIREKIHGANFSFWYDGVTLKCAKRSGFIGELENFFGHHAILKKYEEKIEKLYNAITNWHPYEGRVMIVYGEIAGTMDTGRKVQREVEYGELDFYAFDIKLDGKYLTDIGVESNCQRAGIRTAPLLKIGSFEKLIQTPNDFDSCVFQEGDEFVLEFKGDNVSEGYVLKPNVPAYFGNGERVAIKSKNAKFSEKKAKSKIKISIPALSESDKEVLNTANQYITEARLRNVLSKYGVVTTQKEFGTIHRLFNEDAIEDIIKDFNGENPIKKCENVALVFKQFNNMCKALIGKHFGSIIKGNF